MRASNTYRGARRTTWLEGRRQYPTLTWLGWNDNVYADVGYAIGNRPTKGHITTRPRSKYMPHNGKREMERRHRRHERGIGLDPRTPEFGVAGAVA
jgi:hypothetical protein